MTEKENARRYFCYMVRCADDSLYTGWTTDPIRREKQHNRGTGSAYTSAHRPVKLVYVEEVDSRRTAMQRELAIKGLSRARKEKLIAAGGGCARLGDNDSTERAGSAVIKNPGDERENHE